MRISPPGVSAAGCWFRAGRARSRWWRCRGGAVFLGGAVRGRQRAVEAGGGHARRRPGWRLEGVRWRFGGWLAGHFSLWRCMVREYAEELLASTSVTPAEFTRSQATGIEQFDETTLQDPLKIRPVPR
jgi:hypothetical protein